MTFLLLLLLRCSDSNMNNKNIIIRMYVCMYVCFYVLYVLKKCIHAHNLTMIELIESHHTIDSDAKAMRINARNHMMIWQSPCVRFECDLSAIFLLGLILDFVRNLLTRTTFPTRNDVKLSNTQCCGCPFDIALWSLYSACVCESAQLCTGCKSSHFYYRRYFQHFGFRHSFQ